MIIIQMSFAQYPDQLNVNRKDPLFQFSLQHFDGSGRIDRPTRYVELTSDSLSVGWKCEYASQRAPGINDARARLARLKE